MVLRGVADIARFVGVRPDVSVVLRPDLTCRSWCDLMCRCRKDDHCRFVTSYDPG
jgi:hypothetical protein